MSRACLACKGKAFHAAVAYTASHHDYARFSFIESNMQGGSRRSHSAANEDGCRHAVIQVEKLIGVVASRPGRLPKVATSA